MSMLKWHIKENERRVKRGEAPKETPRYIVSHSGPNRARRRMLEAQARHQGDSPHDLGKTEPRGYRAAKRRAHKAQRLARKAHRRG